MRFLSHPSTGVTRFDRMPASWKDITEAIAAGAGVKKGSEAALEVAGGWIQESQDLGLQLTELLHQPVPVKLNRAERDDPVLFINRVVEGLCNDEGLEIEYLIPDGVSSLKVRVDLKGKTLTSSMTIGAPEDRKTAKSRVNWLLRQLAKTREDGIHIKAAYAGRREDIQAALAKVREDPAVLGKDDAKVCPTRFEVKLISDSGTKNGRPQDDGAGARDARAGVLYRGRTVLAGVGAQRAKGCSQPEKEKQDDGGTEAAVPESGGAGTEDTGTGEHQPHPGGAGDSPPRSDARNVGGMAAGDHVA